MERWFRTVREQFLANMERKQTLSVETLNARFWSWIDNGYHVAEHSSLGATPLLRWQRDIEQIRQVPPATDMRRLFFYRVIRTVRRDSTLPTRRCCGCWRVRSNPTGCFSWRIRSRRRTWPGSASCGSRRPRRSP